jgi:cob(I)alamin adenosyltransferase
MAATVTGAASYTTPRDATMSKRFAEVSQGLWVSQKYTCRPVSIRSRACCAISDPWSHVSDRRSCSGKEVIGAGLALRSFVLPDGSQAAAEAHVARAGRAGPNTRSSRSSGRSQ